MKKSYVKTESFATFLARDDDDFGVVKMMKVLAGRRKVRDVFDVLTEMWGGWKCMGNRGVNLEKQKKLNLKSKTEIFSVSIKFLYTWLPCWHVYKTTWHAGRQLSSTNRAFGRNDYFDGRLLNSGIKRAFRWIGGHFCLIRKNSVTNLSIQSLDFGLINLILLDF